MNIQRGYKMNKSEFIKNGCFSLLGFFIFSMASAGFVWILPGFTTAQCAAILFSLFNIGLLFYGRAVLAPLRKLWQTVLSVSVLPIAVLAVSVGCAYLFGIEVLLLPALSPGNLLHIAICKTYTPEINVTVFYTAVMLVPFLCMSIGAAVRGIREAKKEK